MLNSVLVVVVCNPRSLGGRYGYVISIWKDVGKVMGLEVTSVSKVILQSLVF